MDFNKIIMSPKDEKIIKDSEAKGIPIFVFTAKDNIAISVLDYYRQLCRAEECPQTHISEVSVRIDEFKSFAKNNPDKMKLPD
jgi:hypothetical protein